MDIRLQNAIDAVRYPAITDATVQPHGRVEKVIHIEESPWRAAELAQPKPWIRPVVWFGSLGTWVTYRRMGSLPCLLGSLDAIPQESKR